MRQGTKWRTASLLSAGVLEPSTLLRRPKRAPLPALTKTARSLLLGRARLGLTIAESIASGQSKGRRASSYPRPPRH